MTKSEGLHVKSRFDEIGNILDNNLSCDIEPSEGAAFDDVSRVVGLSWVYGENFLIGDIHLWSEKV